MFFLTQTVYCFVVVPRFLSRVRPSSNKLYRDTKRGEKIASSSLLPCLFAKKNYQMINTTFVMAISSFISIAGDFFFISTVQYLYIYFPKKMSKHKNLRILLIHTRLEIAHWMKIISWVFWNWKFLKILAISVVTYIICTFYVTS